MKIYLSGPVSSKPPAQARADFAAAASEIERRGHEPVNPCLLQNILKPETTSWEQYMEAAIGLLRASDAIVMLPGWETSKGARQEYREILGNTTKHKEIFYRLEDVPRIRTEAADGE